MENNKNYIIQEIDNLKKDIQILINDKKNIENKSIMVTYESNKNIKMQRLKQLTEQLKNIYKKERETKQRKNDLISVTKTMDNLEFRNAKKNGEKLTRAKQNKELRRQAHEKYLEYLQLEEIYFQNDPKALPGTLFLHQTIIKEYGLCPYIRQGEVYKTGVTTQQDNNESGPIDNGINDNKEQQSIKIETKYNGERLTDIIYNKRSDWLSLQKDNGKLYYDLYDTLINKKELVSIKNNIQLLEEKINKIIEDLLTESQYKLWGKAILFIEEYIQYNIKTKRLKERFKIFIHNISILYSETNVNLHKYLSLKYNCNIDVNLIEIQDNNVILTDDKSRMGIVFGETFDVYVTEYQTLIDTLKTKEKFLTNTLKNLKQDLCLYLIDDTAFVNTYIVQNVQPKQKSNNVQVGKYFKRWLLLTQEERLERFESYAIYYVQKFLIEKDIIDVVQRDDTVTILSDLLKSAFSSKKMIYRDIVWNTTKGLIENVKILHYDKELGFVLKYTKPIVEKEAGTNNIVKKKVSVRTVITKESEKIINEDLLYFIVKRIQEGIDTITKEDKESFAERIKTKLKIKKITVNDKLKIFAKYDEIFEIVKSNKQ